MRIVRGSRVPQVEEVGAGEVREPCVVAVVFLEVGDAELAPLWRASWASRAMVNWVFPIPEAPRSRRGHSAGCPGRGPVRLGPGDAGQRHPHQYTDVNQQAAEFQIAELLGIPLPRAGAVGVGVRLGAKGAQAGARAAAKAAGSAFRLTSLGNSLYETPTGLIHGPGSKHGHRLTHVLQHGFPDTTKKKHSVFSTGSGALKTVDEAWMVRGAPDLSDPGKYVVPTGREVGTAGETSVTIIVQPGTPRIITAYPSP
ncbi:hypothetical protein JOD67_000362 [Tenggerimyces flavus]|nr:hypothetical protein [Tenggerimyces flavus]